MGLWRGISGLVASVLTELDYLVATRQGTPAAVAIIRYAASRVAAARWEAPAIGPLLLAAASGQPPAANVMGGAAT